MSRWSNVVPPLQCVTKCRSACVNSGDVCDVYHVCQSLHIPSDMLVFCLCGIHCTVWCSYIRSLCLANWWLGWWPWYKQAQPCYKQIVRSANLRQPWLGKDWGVVSCPTEILHSNVLVRRGQSRADNWGCKGKAAWAQVCVYHNQGSLTGYKITGK